MLVFHRALNAEGTSIENHQTGLLLLKKRIKYMTESEKIIAHIENLIFYADKIAGKQFHLSDNSGKLLFEIKHQPKGNHSLSLKNGYMAVYTFVSDDGWLKVGQVSKNSNQRYKYDHYKTDKGSTLARSLINDPDMVSKHSLDKLTIGLTIGDWIKKHCDRYDVWIDSSRFSNPKIVLNFVEGLLQYNLNPRYEG